MNPIYIDYYSHEHCTCFKIDLPWTKYAKDTRVLCRVEQGYEMAKILALNVLITHMQEKIKKEVK